jgi:hypothetical protein
VEEVTGPSLRNSGSGIPGPEFRSKLILPWNDLIPMCVPPESEIPQFRKMRTGINRNTSRNAQPSLQYISTCVPSVHLYMRPFHISLHASLQYLHASLPYISTCVPSISLHASLQYDTSLHASLHLYIYNMCPLHSRRIRLVPVIGSFLIDRMECQKWRNCARKFCVTSTSMHLELI